MRHGSLFSGIGGFDLAAEWMGWENVFHCEWNPFGQKILKHYWPNAKSYGDITKTDFREWNGKVDIVSGGFPCQPFSSAGKRKGKEDHRFLWPEMLRAIKEIQPTWILAENVYGIINQERGLVFEQVQIEMENEGYEVQSYLLPACGVNAPHRRDRFWFVAYSGNKNGSRFTQRNEYEKKNSRRQTNGHFNVDVQDHWKNRAIESGILGRNHGLPKRMDRISAFGNTIVPQVAYEIFKAIEEFEKQCH